MKNKITLIVIGLLILVGVGYFIFTRPNKTSDDPKSLLNEKNTVLVNDELSNQELTIQRIKIENITLNQTEKSLYFGVSSSEKQEDVKVTLVLLNPDEKEQANEISLIISEIEDSKLIKFDLKEIYNNPKKIKFIIEK